VTLPGFDARNLADFRDFAVHGRVDCGFRTFHFFSSLISVAISIGPLLIDRWD